MFESEQREYTYADYSALPEGAPYQLVRGFLVKHPSPTPYHQNLSGKIMFDLMEFVRDWRLGTVLAAPIDVYFGEHDIYQPDIIYIAAGREEIIGDKKIEAPPDLVVEILSPSNAYYDLGHKRRIYESSGVREFWVIDPMDKSVEVYRNDGGRFIPFESARETGEARSYILEGFILDLDRLF